DFLANVSEEEIREKFENMVNLHLRKQGRKAVPIDGDEGVGDDPPGGPKVPRDGGPHADGSGGGIEDFTAQEAGDRAIRRVSRDGVKDDPEPRTMPSAHLRQDDALAVAE